MNTIAETTAVPAAKDGAPALPACPPWCELEHSRPEGWHQAFASVPYASARMKTPRGTLQDPDAREVPGNPYCVDLCQEDGAAPDIRLTGNTGDPDGSAVLTLDEAEQVGRAILAMVAAAREGRSAD